MISTADVVSEIIRNQPLLEDGLSRGIISYSALARDIRPQIEEKLMKKVTRGAIVMAVKRVSKNLKNRVKKTDQEINLTGITVRSDLVELTYANSETIAGNFKHVFSIAEKHNETMCNLSQGIRETMFIVGKDIVLDIEKLFRNERYVAKVENLSSITILLAKNTINIPGVYYSILKLFAWNDISVIDIISTFSELTIIFNNKDIDTAFSLLKNYKK
ncbi:MAG TPA: hypothetical protein VMR41_03995 [Patescibacteria group bacterium]|nr:hypothetical protein [Patescibacteria group bacterium]